LVLNANLICLLFVFEVAGAECETPVVEDATELALFAGSTAFVPRQTFV
jgi:hypothetical protein